MDSEGVEGGGPLQSPKNGYDRMHREPERRSHGRLLRRATRPILDAGKTERECVAEGDPPGARPRASSPTTGAWPCAPGDKDLPEQPGQDAASGGHRAEVPGGGCRITAAHIDSPRLDLKPNPLYEDSELAYLKTHYYGGIRKYQWVTIPWSSTAWWPWPTAP